jgi:hypothetical protein
MTIPDDVGQQPLVRAVLGHLAATRGTDPLGSLARTVPGGEADLRTAAAHPWHGQALGPAFADALQAQRRLSPQQRDDIEGMARRFCDAGADVADDRGDSR